MEVSDSAWSPRIFNHQISSNQIIHNQIWHHPGQSLLRNRPSR